MLNNNLIKSEGGQPMRILLIDDQQEVYEVVQRALSGLYEVVWAESIKTAQKRLADETYDLVLLDILLDDGNGYDFCAQLMERAKTKHLPVIFLTSKSQPHEKVLGFSLGAEDYIIKPIEPHEFRARIGAKMRKLKKEAQNFSLLRRGPVEIEVLSQKAHLVLHGKREDLNLTPVEFRLLYCLSQRPGVLFSREQLLETLWGENVHVYLRSIDTHISKLRRKLGEAADLIQSRYGQGYIFVEDYESFGEKISPAADQSAEKKPRDLLKSFLPSGHITL